MLRRPSDTGRLEFLGDDRVDGIGAHARGREIQQGGKISSFRCGGDGIAGSDVHLQRDAPGTEADHEFHPQAAVFVALSDFFGDDRIGIELESVGCDRGRDDRAEGCGDHRGLHCSEPEEIQVLRRTRSAVVPEDEKHRALEQEAIGVLRLAEPIKQALDAVAHHDVVERFVPRSRDIQQAGLDGGGQIFRRVHASISR